MVSTKDPASRLQRAKAYHFPTHQEDSFRKMFCGYDEFLAHLSQILHYIEPASIIGGAEARSDSLPHKGFLLS